MARMYEMNLVIRLQDRASARMRRISGDMSALARHAQSQNRLMQLQAEAQRVQMKQGAALSTLRSMEVSDGEKRLANLAAQSSLTKQLLNQEIAMSTARTKRGTMGTIQVQRVIPKSVREDFIRLETDLERQQFLKRKGYNATEQAMMYDYHALRTRQLLLEGKITEEMAAQNRILAGTTAEEAALNAEIAQRSALTARGAAAEKNYVRGRTIAHGGSLAFMGGAVTTGLAGLAASSYAKFDVSSTKAATQVGAIGNSAAQTTKQAKELEKAILGMATEFPASADDMAQSAYDIFSSMSLGDTAVEQMTNGIKLLKVANKAAVGGQIDLGTATNTMITVLNDFNPSLKNIDHTMAQLFSTVRFMRGGFGDLGDAMNKLAPAAHASGQSLLEVGAAIAQVTRGIPSQAQAGTSVARLLDVFGRPDFQEGMRKFSAKFKQDLDITKVAADGTERLIPLHDIISKIVKLSPHLTGGGVDLQNTIKIITALGSASGKGGTQSTVQSRRALTELIIGYKNYSSILKQSREDTVEYDKSVKALSETAGVKWQIAMNKLKVAWIQFGQAAMPILLKVLDLLTRAFEHFSRMSSGHKKIIASLIVIAGLVATVGGLFASAFGGIFMLLAWNRLRLVLKATEALGVGAEVTATKIGLISKALLIMRRLAGPIAVVVSILYNISDKKKRHKIWDDAKHGMLGSAALELTVGTDFGIGDRFGGRKWKQPAKDREKWIKDALKDALSSKNTFGITNLNKVNKQAAAADKYGTDMLAWAKRMTAAEDASTKKIASYYKRLAKAKVEAAQAGKAAEEQSLKTMEAFMVSKESAFRSSNKQGMDLFGGPGAGGPIMGAFSDINNLLAGLNIKPIPVPVEFILQAQDFQVSQFEDWRSALDMLKKRLGPKYNKMVLELQSQGVASNPLVQSMLKATPAELKQWKTNWDKMQTDIEAATKADIKTLKDLWATYPKDVVTRIMLGLQDEEGTLSNGYRQYLVGTYPQQLAVEYGKAYNESLANWFASNPPPAPPKLPQMPKPKVGSASADRADMAKHPENYNDYPWVTDTPFGITEEMYKRMLKYLGYVTQINGSDFFGNPNLVRKNVVGPPAPVLKSPNMTPKGSQKGAPYRRAGGGIIPGTGSGDTVPAMLTPGEVVLNKRHIKNASQMLGTANHPQAVFNKVQHFAKGGVVAAKNYLGMKDVEFIKSSDGTISVMHVKGRDYLSRYRKYSPGQPGYDLLGTQGLHLTPEQLHPGKTKGLSLSGIGHGIAGLAGKAKRYGTGDLLHDVKSAAISSVKKQKHYGIGDTLRDVDAVIYGATGAHAKSIGKAYVPWVKQSAKQQAEIARVGEGAMFMGLPILGSGLASGMAQSGFMSYSMRASALSYHSATKVAARNAARRANAIHKGMPGSIGQNAFGITPHPHPVGKVVKTDAEEAARASHQANMLAWRREYNELQEKFGDYGTGLTEAEQAANKARRVELTAQMRSATAARPTAARAATSDIISPAQQKIINQREAEAATRLKETGQSTGVRLTKKQHLEKAAKVLEARRTAWRIKNDKIVVDNTEIRTVGLHDANTKLASLVEAATKTSATLGNLGYTSNLNELILHGSEALKGFGLKPKTLKSGSTTRSYREFAALAKAAERAPSTLRVNPDAGFRPGSKSVAIDVLQSFLRDPKQSEFLTKEEAAALAGRAGHGTVFIKDIQKLIGAKGTIAKAEKRMAASRAAFPAKRVSTKKGTQTAATIAKQAEAEKLVKSGEVSINKSTRLRNAARRVKDETGTLNPFADSRFKGFKDRRLQRKYGLDRLYGANTPHGYGNIGPHEAGTYWKSLKNQTSLMLSGQKPATLQSAKEADYVMEEARKAGKDFHRLDLNKRFDGESFTSSLVGADKNKLADLALAFSQGDSADVGRALGYSEADVALFTANALPRRKKPLWWMDEYNRTLKSVSTKTRRTDNMSFQEAEAAYATARGKGPDAVNALRKSLWLSDDEKSFVTHNPQSKAFSRAERLFAALRSETGTLSLPTLATTVARSVLDKARKAKLMAQFKAGHIVRLTPHEAIALREMPGYVFHGTSEANAKSILKSGSILPQGKLNADPAYRAHLAGGSFWPGSIANSRDAGVVLAIPRKRLGDQLDATNIGRGSVEKYGPSQIATGVAAHYASRRGFDISPSLISRVKARTLEDRGSINKSTQNIGPIIEDSDFLKRIMDFATSLHLDGGGTEAEVAGLHEYVLKNYKKHYGSLASKISEALAGQSDVTLTPRGFNYLGSQDVFSAASWKRAERLREGDIDQLFSTLLDNNASDYGMFDVKFGKQSIYSQDRVDLPSMSVWAHDNKLHVDDVMDINDTEVFKTPLQKAMYVSALKSLRGEATEGRIKLYRGMSAKERASWGVGDTIPAGKYFTNIATSQYAQDIAGEFPELHSFLVDAVNIVETDPGSFQLLQDSTLSKLGIISAKSESINKSTRLPAHGLESEIGRVEAQKILDMLAANEPQVDIFRGLRNADFSNIDFDKLGVHWTTDRKIAELYAAPASVKNASGTVLSARTAIGNLIPPGPELEWWIRNAGVKTGMPTHHGSGMMQGRNIPWMDEFEATLRPGSKLNLTGSDLLTSGGKYSAVHDMDLTSAHQTLLGEGINKSTQSDKWKEAAPAVRSLWDRLDAAGGRKSRPKGSRGAEDAAAGFKRASSIWNVHPLLTNDPLTKSGLFAAFAHMDRIHRVPSDHNQLPMGLLQNTDQGATAGIAKHTTSSSRGSIPVGIDLAYPHMMRDFDLYSPNMYELALTAWHEMFHQYDYGFLKDQPKDKWPGSVFAAGAAGISSPYSFDRMRGKFNTSSAEDTLINPQLTEVFSQIYKTKLFDEQAQLGFLFHEPQVIGTYIKSGSDYRSIPYQVAPVELAARAYSQWMMTHPKSGVAMQRGFDKVHKAERDVGHWGRNQLTWDRDDFTGVAKSMEEFLGSKNLLRYAKGGWVPGTGNRDNYPAFLTPGEYVVSKPMIRDLTSRKAGAAAPTTHVTHEQNINVDVTNPTGKAILDALKPVLFGLRHQP